MDFIKLVMLSKLQKYAQYINLSKAAKMKLINQAQMSPSYPNPREGMSFQQQNFVALNVFDSKNQEFMYKLQTYRHNAKGKTPKAIVALFHGLRSHTNTAAHLAHYYAQHGITTVGFDYRGFGKSQGSSAFIQSWPSHMSDSLKFIQLVKKQYPNVPLFACGLSLGGATAYHLTLKHRKLFEGAIIVAPALTCGIKFSSRLGTVNNVFSFLDMFIPAQAKIFSSDPKNNGSNPLMIQVRQKDELYNKGRLKFQTINTLFQMMQGSAETFKSYDCPFMIVHGGRDKIINPEISFDLFSKSATPEKDKDIYFFENMWHDVWHEKQIHQINELTVKWINSRLQLTK